MEKRGFAIVLSVLLCVSMLFTPAAVSADGGDTPAINVRTDAGPAVTALSPAFQQKHFAALNKDNKLVKGAGMENVEIKETSDGTGIFLSGKVSDLTAGKITIAEDYDFSERPESRKTDVRPVGRISADGLSDKNGKVFLDVYLDDEAEPRASMLLRKQMGKTGWTREGDRTIDVLAQNITGTHTVSIGFTITGLKETAETEVLLRSLTFCENSIPVMYFDIDETESSIDAMNSSEDHSTECYGTVTLQVPAGYKSEFSDKVQETTEPMPLEYIRGRGNSTWLADKKPYKLKFEKKQNLLGMGKNRHWVLLANRYDNTLLRNRITYWIVRRLGMEFAIKCSPVEVVMNGRYYGSYLLSEQVRIDENRIDINKLDESVKDPGSTEITGGYLLNMEGYGDDENDSTISTGRDVYFTIESPDFGDYSDSTDAKDAKAAQRKYIGDYMCRTEDAIFGNGMKDAGGHPYTDYMDAQSAADYWWLQEFAVNGDAFLGGSSYLYKKRETKQDKGLLYWGPIWDFDYVAWGNPNFNDETFTGFDNTSHLWMKRLRTDDGFCSRIKARWSQAKDTGGKFESHLSDLITDVKKQDGILDQYYEETRVSQQYDCYRWGFYNESGGSYSSAAKEATVDPAADQTYESEIEQLRSWIGKRQEWVDENIEDVKVPTYKVRFLIGRTVAESRSYCDGDMLGKLPEAPAKSGYTFTGWCHSSGYIAEEECVVFDDMDFTAKYVKTSKLKKAKHIYFQDYDVYTWFDSEDAETYSPTYTIMPENSYAGKISWTVDKPDIAEIHEDGSIAGKKPGTVTVTAKLSTGAKNSYKITFLEQNTDMYDVEEIKLNKKKLTLKTGSYTQLRANMDPKPHFQTNLKWICVDSKVASVDDLGVITAKNPGTTAVIAINMENQVYTSCKLTVKASKAYKIKAARAKKVKGVKARARKKGRKRTVRVSWKKASGVSGYYVLRSTKKNGKYKKVGTVRKAKTVKWTDRKVKRGRKYFYKVQPYTKISKKVYKGKKSAAASVKLK